MKKLVLSIFYLSIMSYHAALFPNAPTILSAESTNGLCGKNQGSITVVGAGTAPLSYTLLDENNVTVASADGETATTFSFLNLKAGTYTVKVTNSEGIGFTKGVRVKNPTCHLLLLYCCKR